MDTTNQTLKKSSKTEYDTPLDTAAMPTGLCVSTPSSGVSTLSPSNKNVGNKKREPFRSPPSSETLIQTTTAVPERPSLANVARLARSTPNVNVNIGQTLSPDTIRPKLPDEPEESKSSPSRRPAATRSQTDSPAKRSGTQDTCFKVLPAAVKVRVNDRKAALQVLTMVRMSQKYSLKHVRLEL